MDSLPSPAPSPVLVTPASQEGLVSRKRARSTSSEASSSKRAMSEDPSSTGFSTPSAVEQSDMGQSTTFAALKLSSVPPLALNDDIDAYMQSQEQGSEPMAIEGEGMGNSGEHSPLQDDPVAPEERYKLIRQLKGVPMKENEVWYVVSRSWFRRWEKACTGEVDKEGLVLESQLGPVDNSSIADEKSALVAASLLEGVDVEYVPKAAWNCFVKWYGEPNRVVPRNVVIRGILKEPVLELRPPSLQVMRLIKSDALSVQEATLVHASVSAVADLNKLYAKMLTALNIEPRVEYRVWKVDGHDLDGTEHPSAKLKAEGGVLFPLPTDTAQISKTLEEALVHSDECFVVETKIDGEWIVDARSIPKNPDIPTITKDSEQDMPKENAPLFTPGTDFFSKYGSSSSPSSSSMMQTTTRPIKGVDSVLTNMFNTATEKNLILGVPSKSTTSFGTLNTGKNKEEKSTLQPGILGLGNMGNTCFMNSALQCLAHTEPLVEYFLTGVFQDELNPSNPLGMQGAIAEVFGALLRRIWKPMSSASSFSPREFKIELQRFAPQFSGYQQHDSQELVAFLLDGLHEDLNRVLQKPYVEKPDWEGGGDRDLVDLAVNSWEGYMKRNDSVIVDLFQGQYKSTLVCPECQKVSITFDPFMYLTLPLPIQKKWTHSIYYIPWDIEKEHVKVPVEVNRNSSFKEVRQLLGRWMDVNPDNLLTLEVFSNRFYKDLDDTILVGDMSDSDTIVCFELPCHAQQSRTWKPNEDPEKDPVILAVHLSRETGSSRSTFRSNSNNGFAHPFVIVLNPEQARNKQLIYDAIVDRLQRWTTNARDLFQWEHEMDADDHVPIQLSNAKTAVTEFKENGDVNVLEPEEEDIVDAKGVILEEGDAMPTGSVKKLGPKLNLFEMTIQSGHDKFGTGSSWSVPQRWERWETRGDGPLVKKGDALYCEWDENLRTYYFGDDIKMELSKWKVQCWGQFIHPEYEEAQAAAKSKQTKGINLYDCLEEFTKEEKLGEDDLWYCPRCKKHQQATKKFDVWTVPDILVVHLKRFSNSRVLRDKIDAFVDFPVEGLDLSHYCEEREVAKRLVASGENIDSLGLSDLDESLLYDLYGVDEHLGGLGGGHYRAYAKHHETGVWYHFDDSYVTQANANDAVNANAYLLFYKRRTSTPLGGKTYQKVALAQSKAKARDEAPTRCATPEEDSAPSSASKSMFSGAPAFRYPTPVTNSHASPATSSPPLPLDENELRTGGLEVLELDSDGDDEHFFPERGSPSIGVQSELSSPVSSTGAEPDVEPRENDDLENEDWNAAGSQLDAGPWASPILDGRSIEDSLRVVPIQESNLLDIDE